MRKLNLFGLLLAGMSASALVGCSEDISIADQMNEDYVKSFIEKYGLPGEGNMFNMAKRGQVTVKSSQPTYVEVIAMENGKYYSFAYCEVSGTQTIHFDIPSNIQDIVLYVNDQYYPTKIGATYDLDHPTRSRDGEATVWTDDMLENVEIQVIDKFSEELDDGRLIADLSELSEIHPNGAMGTHNYFNHLGIDLKKYVSDDPKVYEQYNNHGNGPWRNGSTQYIDILNVHKQYEDHEYEIGIYYGAGETLLTSEKVIFIPFYRTGSVKNGASVVTDFYGREDNFSYERAGVEFTIDFAGEGALEFMPTSDFTALNQTKYYSGGFVKDNIATYGDNSLEARLDKHAKAQSELPALSVLRENGATDYTPNLPKLEDVEDAWDFYDNYDEYIWNYLEANPGKKADIHEYDQFKQLLATNWREIPEHAIPYVTYEGGQKYRVTYITAYRPKSLGAPVRHNGSLMEIQDNHIYAAAGISFTVPGANTAKPHDFVFYMKDLTTGVIMSSANGSRIKSTAPYIMTENYKAESAFPITMIDFDGDGVYNDFVYQAAWPGTGTPGPKFDEYTWYLACEDLGSTGDCDFNDAVFAIQYVYGNSVTVQNINVRPLAAGGIYPTYLMWSDGNTNYMVGKEIHSWLGEDTRDADGNLPFINTKDESYTDKGAKTATFEWDIPGHDMKRFTFDAFENNLWGKGGTMAGFWLLVDKDNSIAELANQDITFSICDTEAMMAKYPTLWKVNNHPVSENSIVPQMMLVTQEWEWPIETINIENAYKKWHEWMGSSNPTEVKWYGYQFEEVDRSNVVKRWAE